MCSPWVDLALYVAYDFVGRLICGVVQKVLPVYNIYIWSALTVWSIRGRVTCAKPAFYVPSPAVVCIHPANHARGRDSALGTQKAHH